MWIADVGRTHLRRLIASTGRPTRTDVADREVPPSQRFAAACRGSEPCSTDRKVRAVTSSGATESAKAFDGASSRRGHERVRASFAQRSSLGEAWRSRVGSWLPSTTSGAPGVLPWSSPKRESLACVRPPRSTEARRPAQVATSGLGSWRLGPGSRAAVPRVVPRGVRGMNELGKAHPAGEARWVRVESLRRRPRSIPQLGSRRS
jgi:hypothetical protein